MIFAIMKTIGSFLDWFKGSDKLEQMLANFKIWWEKAKRFYRYSDRFLHLLVGMPSYDKYLEHMKNYHPDQIPKTRKEFFTETMKAKYGAGRSRC